MRLSAPLMAVFAVAAATGTVLWLNREDPVPPMIGYVADASDMRICGITMIGLDIGNLAGHCVSKNLKVVVHDKNGNSHTAQMVDDVHPGSLLLRQFDKNAPDDLVNNGDYYDVASDKAIVRLDSAIGLLSGAMKPQTLDNLKWTGIENSDLSYVDVLMTSYRPRGGKIIAQTFKCKMVRKKNVDEVVAHTCPTVPGYSGSPLYTKEPDGTYSLYAVHQGQVRLGNLPRTNKPENQLAKVFEKMTVLLPAGEIRDGYTPWLRVASTVYNFAQYCKKEVKNCDIH